jgi:hypothetical protein
MLQSKSSSLPPPYTLPLSSLQSIALTSSQCHHKGNWIQIPGCGGYITVFLKQVQCEHPRCKKCDKLSGFTDDDDLEDQERRKRKKGLMAWFLRTS